MNKKIIILVCTIVIILILLMILNFSDIENYINNKEWQIAETIGTIQLDKSNQIEIGNMLVALNNNSIDLYSDTDKPVFSIDTMTSEIAVCAAGDYTVVGDKSSGNIYMLKDNSLLWETKVNGAIYNLTVNKNGYVAVIYSLSGYKSVVKVIKNNSEEMFTTFLATTYATDVSISSDNKFLAISEVNTEGIKISSILKIIEIDKISDEKVINVPIENNSLILDIEYTNKGELFVLQDNKILLVRKNNMARDVTKYDSLNAVLVAIENCENPIVVRKNGSGLFGSECILEIYSCGVSDEIADVKKEYKLPSMPQSISARSKIIGVNMGNEALFINTNGKLIKRFTSKEQIREIKLYNNGELAALIYRNRIELIKI